MFFLQRTQNSFCEYLKRLFSNSYHQREFKSQQLFDDKKFKMSRTRKKSLNTYLKSYFRCKSLYARTISRSDFSVKLCSGT